MHLFEIMVNSLLAGHYDIVTVYMDVFYHLHST